jgi:tRNA(fMet)-specific endonuclease VapC
MTLRMLDTNAVSNYIKRRLANAPSRSSILGGDYCISAVSEGELLFGLHRRPEATSLNHMILTMIEGIGSVPFDSNAASRYGTLRAEMQRIGKSLTALDMMIAAHALSLGATLVTSDAAFRHVPGLAVEDWS